MHQKNTHIIYNICISIKLNVFVFLYRKKYSLFFLINTVFNIILQIWYIVHKLENLKLIIILIIIISKIYKLLKNRKK